ncbi:EexN family lipoprotein [Salmonella enterica]|uniref:EexN family lipoprotein n=1 Tax=Salmonella enterica TaxID=28901 RepID=UPI0009AF3A22|nr:EexN family lipoprotein [Salmonella enterica]
MKKSFYLISAVVLTISITACKEQKSEAWYKEHPTETYNTYSDCLKSGESSDNCEFSYRAAKMFARSDNPEISNKFTELFNKKDEIRKQLTN